MSPELWVVLPVYNERESIEAVLREWLPVLRSHTQRLAVCVLNDGSRDDTLSVLRKLEPEFPELVLVDKPNSGHGQTCVEGYRRGVDAGAEWIFQIDSDGQCDPRYFAELWQARHAAAVVYGFRRQRDDGWHRLAMSRVMSAVGFFSFGVWSRDANVPYRLMRRDVLASVLPQVPADFVLANVLVALLQQRQFEVCWRPIGFRRRSGGVASVRALAFAERGLQLYRQLRRARATTARRAD